MQAVNIPKWKRKILEIWFQTLVRKLAVNTDFFHLELWTDIEFILF
jgi:hypothetical protein